MTTVIVDYGIGNLGAIPNMLRSAGEDAVISDRPDVIELAVWERGAGITQACGTGACAAAHVAHQWGLVGDRVREFKVVSINRDSATLVGGGQKLVLSLEQ